MALDKENIAVNPKTGEVAIYDGENWKIIPKSDIAVNRETNAAKVYFGDDWHDLPARASDIEIDRPGPQGENIGKIFARNLNNVSDQVLTSLTLGANRLAEAAIVGAYDAFKNDKPIGEAIAQQSHQISQRNKQFESEHPYAATALEFLGGTPWGLGLGSLAAKNAGKHIVPHVASRVVPGLEPVSNAGGAVLAGAVPGAIYGAATSDLSEGAPEVITNAATGAVGGGVLGGLTYMGGKYAGKVQDRVLSKPPQERNILENTFAGLFGPRHQQKAHEAYMAQLETQKAVDDAAERLKQRGFEITPFEQYGDSVSQGLEQNASNFARSREVLRKRQERNLDRLRVLLNREIGLPDDALPTPKNIEAHRKSLYAALENSQVPVTFDGSFFRDVDDALANYKQLKSFTPGIDPQKNYDAMLDVLNDYKSQLRQRVVGNRVFYELDPKDYVKLYQRVTAQRRKLSQSGMTQEEAKVFDDVLASLDRFGDMYSGPGMNEFRKARNIYKLEMNSGITDGNTIDPKTGKIDPDRLVENLKRNDAYGFVKNNQNTEFYETLADLNALHSGASSTIPGIGKQVSTSIYSTLLRPIYEAHYKRKIGQYLNDPGWHPDYPGGDKAMSLLVPGLLQATQLDSPLYGILKEQYLNPDDGQF